MEATTITGSANSKRVPIGREEIYTRHGSIIHEKQDSHHGKILVPLNTGELILTYSIIKHGDGPMVIDVNNVLSAIPIRAVIETERHVIESLADALIDIRDREGAEAVWHTQAPWLAYDLRKASKAVLLRQED